MDALTHAIDRTLDTIEGGMPLSPETKALRRPAAGGTSEKQAIVAIGKEVLRQGQLIDRLARQPGDPTTLRGAHDLKMRAWGTYQDLLTRERREARRGRPDSLTRRGLTRLDGDLDRMGALERRLARVEAKRNRPPMGQPSGMIRTYDPGMRPAGKTRIGAYLSSATMRAYRGAVVQHLKTGSEMFHGLHIVDLHRLATKDMHTELNPSGGYFMMPERDNSPLATFLTELSPMRERATVRSILTDEFEQPTVLSNAEANWVGERAERVETDSPTLGIDRQFTHLLEAEPFISAKLLDDANLDLEAWITEQIGTAFAEKESPAWFDGTGLNQPRGLLTYDFVAPASWAHGKFRYLATGVSGGFQPTAPTGSPPTMPDNILIDVVQTLKAGHRKNATWLMNRSTAGVIRKMRDERGLPLWQPSTQAGQPAALLGHAVDEDEFMPDVGADTMSIGFGDWKRTYQILDRIGVRVLRDPYTKKGFVKFFTTKRVGGAVRYFDAAVFLKFGTS